MPLQDHEALAQRLTQILFKFNQGEHLTPAALAEEFGVTLRTIQRDLSDRLGFLPIEKVKGKYHLHPSALGKLTLQDMRQFASMAGVQGLFPDLSQQFLRELFDSRVEQAWMVKGPEYEDHNGREAIFAQLSQTITAKLAVSFAYTKAQLDGQPATTKTYDPAHPYKLVNHGGVWYLAAEHEGKLKAFVLGKIERLLSSATAFEPQADLLAMLQNEDSIWLNAKKYKVVIQVAKEASIYFERRKLVGGQVIEKRLEDGGLIVSAQVAHPNQILPIVRYWIPHVRVISPEGLQGEMEHALKEYFH
jgi:predicted DNA-binding transcriptional regulator YafY